MSYPVIYLCFLLFYASTQTIR